MSFKLRLLGTFDVQPLAEPCSRKAQWLLALLAVRHDRNVERSWLAGTLWPDASESQALYNLRRELTRLRRALGAEAGRLQASTPQTLRLDALGADIDVITFDAEIARGVRDALERGVAQYRGSFLEGCTQEWVLEEREPRRQTYLAALEKLAEDDLQRSDAASAVQRLRNVMTTDPLRESALRTLMGALAATGQHAAACRAYRDLRLLLDRELQAEPSLQTREVYESVRGAAQARATHGAVPQLSHSRIPQPLTWLVGRGVERAEIQRRVRSARLFTVTGAGGVGKSRLALQVASDLAPELADGACFIELAALSDPQLVVAAVASALDIPEGHTRPVIDIVIAELAPRQLLVVLDNCEHLVAACGELAASLLRACPDLRILATSRRSLGLPGEVSWRLPSLSDDDAVALFRERMTAPPGQVSDHETIVEICRRLDGIPLAIELAAARTRVLSLAQIRSRLADRFDLVAGGSSKLPRHRTLLATLEWSYQLLDEPEQVLLRRLSVFAGGWTLEAAETIHGGEVLDLLDSLVDRSLVVFSGRYRMLETVRHYASTLLEAAGETAALRQCHLEYVLALAETAEPHIFGGDRTLGWMDRLEAEADNFRAAFEWCASHPARADAALRLVAALHWYWFARGHLGEGAALMDRALQRLELVPLGTRGRALAAAGNIVMWAGDYAKMPAYLDESIAIGRQLDDTHLVVYATCGRAAAAVLSGDPARARTLLESAIATQRSRGDSMLLGLALYWLGTAHNALDEPAFARMTLEEGLAVLRRLGASVGCGHLLHRLGDTMRAEGDLAAATAHYRESLRMFDRSDRWSIAVVLDALGRIAAFGSDAARAARLLGAAEALCDAIGSELMRAEPGDFERAVATIHDALGEAAFTASWHEGRALDLPRALAYALAG